MGEIKQWKRNDKIIILIMDLNKDLNKVILAIILTQLVIRGLLKESTG